MAPLDYRERNCLIKKGGVRDVFTYNSRFSQLQTSYLFAIRFFRYNFKSIFVKWSLSFTLFIILLNLRFGQIAAPGTLNKIRVAFRALVDY